MSLCMCLWFYFIAERSESPFFPVFISKLEQAKYAILFASCACCVDIAMYTFIVTDDGEIIGTMGPGLAAFHSQEISIISYSFLISYVTAHRFRFQ